MRIPHPASAYSAGSEPTRSGIGTAMFADWLLVKSNLKTVPLCDRLIDAHPKTMLSDDIALAR
jgi:hypothetical protein